jgi:Zinc finger, C3HC4 type (RING finger)
MEFSGGTGTGTVICNICIDDVPLDKVVTLTCNPVHTFCYKCIFDWYKQPNHKKYSTGQKNKGPRVCPICRKDGGPLPVPEGEKEVDGIHNVYGSWSGKVKSKSGAGVGSGIDKSFGTCQFEGCDKVCYTLPTMALDPFTHTIYQIDACSTHVGKMCVPASRAAICNETGSGVMALKNGAKVVPYTCVCEAEMDGGANHCTKVASLISPKWLGDPENDLLMDTSVKMIDSMSLQVAGVNPPALPYREVKEPLCVDHTLLYKHGVELRLKGGGGGDKDGKVIEKGTYTGKKLNTHCLAPIKSRKGSVDVCLNTLNELCECKVKKHNTDIFVLPGENEDGSKGGESEEGKKPKAPIKKSKVSMTVFGNSITVTATGSSSTTSLLLNAVTPADSTLCGTPLKNGNGVCCVKGKAEFGGKCGKHKVV